MAEMEEEEEKGAGGQGKQYGDLMEKGKVVKSDLV